MVLTSWFAISSNFCNDPTPADAAGPSIRCRRRSSSQGHPCGLDLPKPPRTDGDQHHREACQGEEVRPQRAQGAFLPFTPGAMVQVSKRVEI
jgi:hypothetical protein